MSQIPKFRLYGEGDPQVEEEIQPRLELRGWCDLNISEKKIALQQLTINGWINDHSWGILRAINHLNDCFLRECPGENLHLIVPESDFPGRGGSRGNEQERQKAALQDFQNIFLQNISEGMVYRMLTKLAENHVDGMNYERAEKETDKKNRVEYIEKAFKKFDRLANCLNHIFQQFALNTDFRALKNQDL